MARKVVVLALVLFAIVGLALAEAPKKAAAPNASDEGDDDVIGLSDDDSAESPNAVVAGPLGAPVSPGKFAPSPQAPSAASALQVSALAGAATAALAGFFYF